MNQFPTDFQEMYMMGQSPCPYPSMYGHLVPEEQIDTMDQFPADFQEMYMMGQSPCPYPSMYGHLVPEEQIDTMDQFPTDFQGMYMMGQSPCPYPSMYGHLVPEEQVQQGAGPAEESVANHELQNTTNMSCAICLMDYVVGEKILLLMCDHIFHALCVGTWLQENNSCPICRADV